MKKFFSAVLVMAVSFAASAQIQSLPVRLSNDTARGQLYRLPKTILRLEVQTRCVRETPGIYFQYAERFLGLTDVCQTENVRYELTGVRASTRTVVDTSQTYVLSMGKLRKYPSVQLSPEGFLLSLDGKAAPTANAPSGCKGSCGGTACDGASCEARNPVTAFATQPASIFTREMQQASSTAKMAELAANQIFTLRESRFSLLTQDLDKTPSDGRSYEIVLGELNRMENLYLELFKGRKTESVSTKVLEYEPVSDTSEILFRFSTLLGLVDKDNLAGSPVILKVRKTTGLADSARLDQNPKTTGLYYRVPAEAEIRLEDGKNTLLKETFTLPQFGKVLRLESSRIHSAAFCPKTGALVWLGE